MYIEFTPKSLWFPSKLSQEIDAWASKYGVQYRHKLVKNTVRLTFDEPLHYNLFAISWDPDSDLADVPWRFVEPMDINFGKQ